MRPIIERKTIELQAIDPRHEELAGDYFFSATNARSWPGSVGELDSRYLTELGRPFGDQSEGVWLQQLCVNYLECIVSGNVFHKKREKGYVRETLRSKDVLQRCTY